MGTLRTLALAAVAAFSCGVFAASAAVPSDDLAPYLRPQRLVDVGGHAINVYCTGRGSPTVVMDAGEGETMSTWRKVQPAIAKVTRTCSFDRAGMGFSEAGPLPRDANAMVRDLHSLLQRGGIAGPYILVGHSIAGLYALLYADRYPNDVAGMVLVDPSYPNQTRELDAASPTMARTDKGAGDAYAFCYRAALHGTLSDAHGSRRYAMCGFPPDAAAQLRAQCAKNGAAWCRMAKVTRAHYARPAFWLALGSEDGASDALDSREVLKEQRHYGAMPLTVLTAANDVGEASLPPAEMRAVDRVWTAGHVRLAHLSSVGVHMVVRHSEHFIQLDRPDVVTAAVVSTVKRLRESL